MTDRPEHIRIEDLESKLKNTTYLRNQVEFEADGKTVVYVGEAFGLHFDGYNIRGGASLTRFDRQNKGVKKQRKWVRLFPPKFETQEISVIKDNAIWRVSSEHPIYFFLSGYDGTTCKYGHSSTYRCLLQAAAANLGIKLSHELFERVFGPIDAELMKRYRELKRMG